MSTVVQFINRCEFVYPYLQLQDYTVCTADDALFGFTHLMDGIEHQVQFKQSHTTNGVLHINIHHVDSGIVELAVPVDAFFSELDKSVQSMMRQEAVIHHA